uniref:Uncharacterized protein n=1 Tax=Sulfobacillus thermotolerans TaxID=338644 RepID=G5CJ59_9FIRM|nr:hypothetical protein [Sulfobacillus thermotolerans]
MTNRRHISRQWGLALGSLVLLWGAAVLGGITFAYYHSGGGNNNCAPYPRCINSNADNNAVEEYPCGGGYHNTLPITDGSCYVPPSSRYSPPPSNGGGGTFCWAQPSGGDNATVDGNPGYLAACAQVSTPAAPPACTPTSTGPSRFQACDGRCHSGYYEPTNNCGSRNGSNYEGYAPGCTSGCAATPTSAPTICTGTYHWAQTACTSVAGQAVWTDYGPCGQVLSSDVGNATPGTCAGASSPSSGGTSSGSTSSAPSACTPSAMTQQGSTYWTGCASPGVESGSQTYTVYHSCPSYQSSGSRTVTQSTTTTCQTVVEHQCAYAQPGYAQSETCLTSPTGGAGRLHWLVDAVLRSPRLPDSHPGERLM